MGKCERLLGKVDIDVQIDPRLVMYPLLKNFDLTIADYSILLFDLLHVPVAQVMLLHKLDHYRKQNREVDFQIITLPVGPIVHSIETLTECIYQSKEAFSLNYSAQEKHS